MRPSSKMRAAHLTARRVLLSASCLCLAVPASANETLSYTYDELGRLVQVDRGGGPSSGMRACYTLDKAGNRTALVVASASCTSGGGGPSFSVSDPSVTEGGTLTFTVTKAGTATGSTSVSWATAPGTATAGSDYTAPAPANLTFTTSETSKTVAVATINDSSVESTETVLLNLSNAVGATIADSQGTGSITDNDSGVSFSIENVSVTEGNPLTFTIAKSGTGSASVQYATASGSAATPADYQATSGTLTFTTSEPSKTVSVSTVNDSVIEPTETLSLNLSNPTNAVIASPAGAVGSIVDNDDTSGFCVGVSFAAGGTPSATEGNPLVFTITKTGTTTASCGISYSTADGTAYGNQSLFQPDYQPIGGTLTFGASETSKTVSVTTNDDSATESSETVKLNISNPTDGGTVSTAQATGTILNDSGCAGISFSVSSNGPVTEGALSKFTVSKAGSTTSTCTIDFETDDISATSPGDYASNSGTLSFTQFQASKTVNVTTVNDSGSESPETFRMTLSGPLAGSVIATATATATINDNDTAANSPPVPTDDFDEVETCGIIEMNVVANDTDPNGDYPLTLVSTTMGQVISSTSVLFGATRTSGIRAAQYTVRDSRGATAVGNWTVTVVPGGDCDSNQATDPEPEPELEAE